MPHPGDVPLHSASLAGGQRLSPESAAALLGCPVVEVAALGAAHQLAEDVDGMLDATAVMRLALTRLEAAQSTAMDKARALDFGSFDLRRPAG